jgi:hypothetical protein
MSEKHLADSAIVSSPKRLMIAEDDDTPVGAAPAAAAVADVPVPEPPRLKKVKCALLLGFLGANYCGMQMYERY